MLVLWQTFLKASIFSIVVAKGHTIYMGFDQETMAMNQPRAKHKSNGIVQPSSAEQIVKGRSQGKSCNIPSLSSVCR